MLFYKMMKCNVINHCFFFKSHLIDRKNNTENLFIKWNMAPMSLKLTLFKDSWYSWPSFCRLFSSYLTDHVFKINILIKMLIDHWERIFQCAVFICSFCFLFSPFFPSYHGQFTPPSTMLFKPSGRSPEITITFEWYV